MDREACARRDADVPAVVDHPPFTLPDGVVYLDGNSLGPPPAGVASRLQDAIRTEWAQGLIRSWNDAGWVDAPARAAARLAPLLGADPTEVVVADSTTVNLFKAVAAMAALTPDRTTVLVVEDDFPTDRYVVEGIAAMTGRRVRHVPADRLADAVDQEVAVVALSHVDYRTGTRRPAVELTARAHAAGAHVVWDLSHSTGAVDVDLHAWDADVAVGCTYKYLNGGPGAPGYLYAAARHADALSPVRGWFSHARPFDFAEEYVPAAGAARFAGGTPPMLSLLALETALRVWEHADLAALETRATSLTATFIELADARCTDLGIEVVTPRDPQSRGAQVTLRHAQAHAVVRALADRGVIGDHRPPDLLRFGFAPLYVRHVDVWDAVDTLRDVLASGAWDDPRYHHRATVP